MVSMMTEDSCTRTSMLLEEAPIHCHSSNSHSLNEKEIDKKNCVDQISMIMASEEGQK